LIVVAFGTTLELHNTIVAGLKDFTCAKDLPGPYCLHANLASSPHYCLILLLINLLGSNGPNWQKDAVDSGNLPTLKHTPKMVEPGGCSSNCSRLCTVRMPEEVAARTVHAYCNERKPGWAHSAGSLVSLCWPLCQHVGKLPEKWSVFS